MRAAVNVAFDFFKFTLIFWSVLFIDLQLHFLYVFDTNYSMWLLQRQLPSALILKLLQVIRHKHYPFPRHCS